jgi:hypothetical protein
MKRRLIFLSLILFQFGLTHFQAQTNVNANPAFGTGTSFVTADEKIDVSIGQSTNDPCAQSATAASAEVTAGNLNPILDWTAVSVLNICTVDPNATSGVLGQTILLPGKTVVVNASWTIGPGRRVRGQQPGTSASPVSVLQACNPNAPISQSCGSSPFPAGFGTTLGCPGSSACGSTVTAMTSTSATFSVSTQSWSAGQFLRVYNVATNPNNGTSYYGTVYYGAITANGSGVTLSTLNPPVTSAAALACSTTVICYYMVETPLVILGSLNSAPPASTFDSELSGVELDCNHVLGCVGWVNFPGQEGTTVNYVNTINFSAGCGRIIAPNSGPYTILGCATNSLSTPTGLGATITSTGGHLGSGTYNWVVTALDGAGGETAASAAVSKVTTGTTSEAALSWTAVPSASAYNVYRTVVNGTTLYLDAPLHRIDLIHRQEGGFKPAHLNNSPHEQHNSHRDES